MRKSIKFEAVRLALIQAVKIKAPKEFVCRVCDTPFRHLHRVTIKGVTTIHMCEHCVEEFNEFFKKKDVVGFESMLGNATGLLFGQHKLECHTPDDAEDISGLYDTSMYKNDHY